MNRQWKIALLSLFLAITALILPNLGVIAFTIHIWYSNETYTHGFLIFPISAWLIWKKRAELASLSPEPSWTGVLPFLALAAVWQLGHQAGVMVVQQYCLIGMIVASSWITLGKTVFSRIAFPLFFLFLSVPVGDALIPSMMNFTADFTVDALHLTGIPVYREGTFFSLPDGNWSVVEACSGLRYLISSATLGILYAYLTYNSLVRRLAFILLSAIVPILANGIRAYMIVMIGHLVGMRYATGIDHLIYGWIFFGFVMLLLFWAGSFFRENETAHEAAEKPEIEPIRQQSHFAPTAIILAIVFSNWAYAAHLDGKLGSSSPAALDAPVFQGWKTEGEAPWIPHYRGSRAVFNRQYGKAGHEVFLFVAYYRNQERGAELVTSGNQLVTTKDPIWGMVGEETIEGPRKIGMVEAKLRSTGIRMLAWEWYWVDGKWTDSPYMAKLYEAESRILHGSDDAAVIVLSAPYAASASEASTVLGDFLDASLPGIESMLGRAAER